MLDPNWGMSWIEQKDRESWLSKFKAMLVEIDYSILSNRDHSVKQPRDRQVGARRDKGGVLLRAAKAMAARVDINYLNDIGLSLNDAYLTFRHSKHVWKGLIDIASSMLPQQCSYRI
jgi:hypothetical protein